MKPGLPLVLLALTPLLACDSGATDPGREVDLEALFRPATPQEIAQVEADWASRSPVAAGVRQETSFQLALGGASATARVLSHQVDGLRHYGVVVTPDGAGPGSLPVLVYAHGGDQGMDVSEIALIAAGLGESAGSFVFVAPSFRSEALRVGAATFASEGEASPWDRDVDDALALLEVALAETPAANPDRIGVIGLSRGGGVALLMSARDPRIDVVVEFFGPTDFFDDFVQGVVVEALSGMPRQLPGLSFLNDRFLRPLSAGTLSLEQVRLELVRRSPVLFAARLARVQLHHGTADPVVEVSQAHSLIAALEALGRGPPADEFHLYPGGGHNPLSLPGSTERAAAFLEAALGLHSSARSDADGRFLTAGAR